jgi:hypothetical protein
MMPALVCQNHLRSGWVKALGAFRVHPLTGD